MDYLSYFEINSRVLASVQRQSTFHVNVPNLDKVHEAVHPNILARVPGPLSFFVVVAAAYSKQFFLRFYHSTIDAIVNRCVFFFFLYINDDL